MTERAHRCPKRMTFGPCGGVRRDASCEVGDFTCPFVGEAPVAWNGVAREPRPVPIHRYVVDFRPALDLTETLAALELFAGRATLLIGDHLDDPPELRAIGWIASLLEASGASMMVTITARDRTRQDCVEAVDQLVASGVAAVHCVTGDHPHARFAGSPPAEFHLDSFELVDLARSGGAFVSACESPSSPPVAERPGRVAEKVRAGADFVVLNHTAHTRDLTEFARRTRVIQPRAALVAPVPVITDACSARALTQFPGLVVDDRVLHAVATASDPRSAGIECATRIGNELSASKEFRALNLSGSAGGRSLHERCEIMVEVMDNVDLAWPRGEA